MKYDYTYYVGTQNKFDCKPFPLAKHTIPLEQTDRIVSVFISFLGMEEWTSKINSLI